MTTKRYYVYALSRMDIRVVCRAIGFYTVGQGIPELWGCSECFYIKVVVVDQRLRHIYIADIWWEEYCDLVVCVDNTNYVTYERITEIVT
jgi:hypothetical protein